MISSVTNHSFQQLHSSPATNLSPHMPAVKREEDESRLTSPVPATTKKVNPSNQGPESQASKKQGQGSAAEGKQKTVETNTSPTKPTNSPIELSEDELKQVQELKQRDIEVRAHEAAHLAAAGQHAQGGAKFTLKRGPDGRSYAIGGSVSIDTSPEADPEATIRKADQIKRAALAPAEPSGQDRSVAAQAAKLRQSAQAQLAEEQRTKPVEEADENPGQVATREDSAKPSPIPAAAEPQAIAGYDANASSDNPSSNRLESSSGADQIQSAAQLLCEICSGDHPTGPHLEANQKKTGEYLAVSRA